MAYQYEPIGVLSTPFREKFGVPRQSLLMTAAHGVLKLNPDHAYRPALSQLDRFSHVWLVFAFHKNAAASWHPLIDTPRVGEGGKVGVFATRSPHRPNPIGLSAVKLERIDFEAAGGIELHLSGVDILDGTPILDIKPYLPYADCLTEATSGWVTGEIERYPVAFSPASLEALERAGETRPPHLRQLVEQMLELDPRPTSQRRAAPIAAAASDGMVFAFRVLDLDIRWQIRAGSLYVQQVVELDGR